MNNLDKKNKNEDIKPGQNLLSLDYKKPFNLCTLIRKIIAEVVKLHNKNIVHASITIDNIVFDEFGSLFFINFKSSVNINSENIIQGNYL